MLPNITVLIVTYDRPREIRLTIDALLQHIEYDGELNWHIADDNSPGNYLPQLAQDYPILHLTATVTKRQGWGANVNKALTAIRNDFIFLCEDDYVAQQRLDLTAGVRLLTTFDNLGAVRYDGISGHNGLNLTVQELTGNPTINFLTINKELSTHFNVYSNRPHLRHRRFHDRLGPYIEGAPLGMTETNYAGRVKETEGFADIAILSNGIDRAFDHIGHSRQGTDLDVNLHRNLR